MSLANLITLSRLPFLLIYLALLYSDQFTYRLAGLFLLIIIFLMDWLDGYVARRRPEVTALGAVLDVALDRAVENILWVVFLAVDLVPLWIPLLFLVRSFLVDGVRGVAVGQGQTVFGMMHSRWGKFLVASRFMRALYGVAKAWIFCQLTLTHALRLLYPVSPPLLVLANQILLYAVAALCVLRGVPVLLESRAYFISSPPPPRP